MGKPTTGQATGRPNEILQNEAVHVFRFARATAVPGPCSSLRFNRQAL